MERAAGHAARRPQPGANPCTDLRRVVRGPWRCLGRRIIGFPGTASTTCRRASWLGRDRTPVGNQKTPDSLPVCWQIGSQCPTSPGVLPWLTVGTPHAAGRSPKAGHGAHGEVDATSPAESDAPGKKKPRGDPRGRSRRHCATGHAANQYRDKHPTGRERPPKTSPICIPGPLTARS